MMPEKVLRYAAWSRGACWVHIKDRGMQQLSPALSALQEAGISVKLAPTIGIAVDHRRRNRSLESLQVGPSPQSIYGSVHLHDLPGTPDRTAY